MTESEKEITERLNKLWIQATASCGTATPQIVEEIRELERKLEELKLPK
jgi:hypothetical protein